MIDRTTIDRIMASADIVDVVKDFVTLRKSGANYKGLCPFHNERTPSFMVSPAKQMCKCFSCGKGGNVVKFIMEHEQLTYPEAMKWLGRKYGIEVREREMSDEQKIAATERESMFVVNEFARDFFTRTLHESVDGMAIGMSYFRRRGLRDDIIRKFQLGYCPESRDALAKEAKQKGYEDKFLEKTGLCFRTNDGRMMDRYSGRVIFPVHTISGRVVAFGGRTLLSKEEQKARSIGKYVNSPESEIYHKNRELYGLYQAKHAIAKNGRAFLVEGYLDVISMHQSGIENIVASSGTSLTIEQVRLLHRMTENVTVLYDGDAAGIHAALRGVDMLLSEGLNVKVLLLPEGEDPDSFAQTHTTEELQQYIEDNQTDFITFKTNLLLRDAKGDPTRRAAVIKDIVGSIAVIPDNIMRQMYVHEFAGRMGIDENTIVNEVIVYRKQIRDGEREAAAREQARGVSPEHLQSQPQGGQQPASNAPQASGLTAEQRQNLSPDDLARLEAMEAERAALEGSYDAPQQAQVAVSKQDVERFAQKSKAQKLLEGCERQLMEAVIRYGGLPLILLPLQVERKFGGGTPTDDASNTQQKTQKPVEDPESPLVAPFVYDSLATDEIKLATPLYERILTEAANLADEAYAVRRAAVSANGHTDDDPPFFDALNFFKMHADVAITQAAEALTDDRYILSSSQAKMHTPDEYRLVEIVPRLVNDYKHAVLATEKEHLLADIRMPENIGDPDRLTAIMQRLTEINQLESLFAQQLGGRVIGR